MKKHTRKGKCKYCGVSCGCNHKENCPAIELLKHEGKGYVEKELCFECGKFIDPEINKLKFIHDECRTSICK